MKDPKHESMCCRDEHTHHFMESTHSDENNSALHNDNDSIPKTPLNTDTNSPHQHAIPQHASAATMQPDNQLSPQARKYKHSSTDQTDPNHPHHDHSHASAATSRSRLIIALAITALVLIIEIIGGIASDSLALIADAGHMAVDSAGLVIALIATVLMSRPRTDRSTWGWARSEVIAAALQAGMLLVICTIIIWESVERIIHPEEVNTSIMLIVGIVGLVANTASLLVLSSDRGSSLNMKAAFLEVLTDALGSVAVILGALATQFLHWDRADGIASLLIAVMMSPRAVFLLRKALSILMEQTPSDLQLADVRNHLLQTNHVQDVHDLHVTTISTDLVVLTAHVAIDDGLSDHERADILHTLQTCVAEDFPVKVHHSTFQLDSELHKSHEDLKH